MIGFLLGVLVVLAMITLFGVRAILKGVRLLMTDVNSIEALIKQIDDETNTVAAKVDAQTKKIADLQAQIDAGTPATSAQLQEISDALQPISDRLSALGSDPANPVPAPTDTTGSGG